MCKAIKITLLGTHASPLSSIQDVVKHCQWQAGSISKSRSAHTHEHTLALTPSFRVQLESKNFTMQVLSTDQCDPHILERAQQVISELQCEVEAAQKSFSGDLPSLRFLNLIMKNAQGG